MLTLRAEHLAEIADRLATPSYPRATITPSIVHIGVGGFHRAHQAMFLDRLLATGEERWGICGVGLLPGDAAMRDIMHRQQNLYTLVTTGADGDHQARVIGSIVEYLYAPDDTTQVLERLTNPATRIVSLTITEGGYPVDNHNRRFDAGHVTIATDLAAPHTPSTAFGLLAEALRRRRDAGTEPFTVLSCDNIQGNGEIARIALEGYARLRDASLADWIAKHVAFPNSMVDRITPATTEQGRQLVRDHFGVDDEWPVLTEDFAQWIIEDRFPQGRPAFESVGVQLVDDVEPYEMMKLRILNASHQVLSYLGLLEGYRYVHEVCRDPEFATFILEYMIEEAVPTLRAVPGIDPVEYCRQVLQRFTNTAIADTLERQVVDGTERMSKFLVPVIREQQARGGSTMRAALVVAAWCEFSRGAGEDSRHLPVHDRQAAAADAAATAEQAQPGTFLNLPSLAGIGNDSRFREEFIASRSLLREQGVRAALRAARS